jgi:hypothetical protein
MRETDIQKPEGFGQRTDNQTLGQAREAGSRAAQKANERHDLEIYADGPANVSLKQETLP